MNVERIKKERALNAAVENKVSVVFNPQYFHY